MAGTYISIPDTIVAGPDLRADVERGLFFVPENRRDPASRVIPVHFLRFPAKHPEKGRPPVFLLPGGPGSEPKFEDPDSDFSLSVVERLSRTRDVVYVSQRGNPKARGLVPDLWQTAVTYPLDQPVSMEQRREKVRAGLRKDLQKWASRGVDLSGYDILNAVDDVYELRAALGYERIVLRGCSFGSQWSLSYIKRWPKTVDRALLSGVEPLDYAYDSPKELWASLGRLAKRAQADETFAKEVPQGGLLKALQGVIERLERRPETVTIEDPGTRRPVTVTVGANDVRALVADLWAFGESTQEALGNWPRFIVEMSRGELRFLAAKAGEARRGEGWSEPLIGLLIDNSLAITAKRDAQLLAEPEARWLGDINADYHSTRELTPTPDVGDAFRADWTIDTPVLLVNGDLDWSTPIENARHLRRSLKHGHLVEVEGSTHCDEVPELARAQPQTMERIYSFLDADFEGSTPEAYFATLPKGASYPPIRFARVSGPSLYEEWLAKRRPAAAAPQVTVQSYANAEKWIKANALGRVKNLLVKPRWIDGEAFWYRRETDEGHEFTVVDAGTGEKRRAFDHVGLARELVRLGERDVAAKRLDLTQLTFLEGGIRFSVAGRGYRCETGKPSIAGRLREKELSAGAGRLGEKELSAGAGRLGARAFPDGGARIGQEGASADGGRIGAGQSRSMACQKDGRELAGVLRSPDGRWGIETRDANIVLVDLGTGARRALTSDGIAHFGYGLYYGNWSASFIPNERAGEPLVPFGARWSPGSKYVLVTRLDERHVAEYPFVESSPADGSFRPKLHTPRIPLMGEQPARLEWFAIDVATGRKVALALPYEKLLSLHQDWTALAEVWWDETADKLYTVAYGANRSSAYFFEVDLRSGGVRTLIEERMSPRMDLNTTPYSPPNVRWLPRRGKIIWFSQRSGWGHLYLHDSKSGFLERALTQGDWLVRDIVGIDEARGFVYFTASGRDASDPYRRDLYRVSLEGGEPLRITPESADHMMGAPSEPVWAYADTSEIYAALSPDGRYVVYNYSRIDEPTRTAIIPADGGTPRVFEQADASALYAAGWRNPEAFTVKAADGKADLHGVIYHPAGLDPVRRKAYPIIDSQYASPVMTSVPHNFINAIKGPPARVEAASLAALGFAVVVVDARGTPSRSAAFSHYSDGNLDTDGLEDHVAAIRQLAQRHPWMDIDRVGIDGSSYGGFAVFRAMFGFGEFFKVGVATAGIGSFSSTYPDSHWEAYHGRVKYENGTPFKSRPQDRPLNYLNADNALQAKQLKGKLLVLMGELDENVLPGSTLQVVDALIRADKDFDMVYFPNEPHVFRNAFAIRRIWDYFVEHLRGQEPPEYHIGVRSDP